MPSAFLFVDFPVSNMSSIAPTYTCTADARWVKAIYIQDTVGTAGIKLLRTTVFSQNNYQPSITAYDKNFLQIGDAIYRRVHMDMDWLNALTPPIFSNANNSFRSLAALLSDVGIDNSTGLVPQNKTLFPKEPLEAIVATIIADGMSRHGFAANGGSPANTSTRHGRRRKKHETASWRGLICSCVQKGRQQKFTC